jgi:hypothetical protein
MSDTLRAQALRADGRLRWGLYVLAAVAGLVIVALALHLQTGPRMLPHITVRNDTPFELTIVASSTPEGPVTPLGIAPSQSASTFSEVIDEGRTWYFHITCSGIDAGTITRSRASLAQSAWHLEAGADAAGRCSAAGLVPD